jgi:hypothetical protein
MMDNRLRLGLHSELDCLQVIWENIKILKGKCLFPA